MRSQEKLALRDPRLLGVEREQPRVWLEELRINASEEQHVRTLTFKRGLNFVWSPDETAGSASGHDTGKSLLCYLVRFALGEEGFGTKRERNRLLATFPHASIVACVVVMGVRWRVVRSVGRRFGDHAVVDANHRVGTTPSGPMQWDDYRAALRSSLGDAVHPLQEGGDDAWLAALQWLARDQGQLGGLYHWRNDGKWKKRSRLAGVLLRLPVGETDIEETRSTPPDNAQLAQAEGRVEELERRLATPSGAKRTPVEERVHRQELEELRQSLKDVSTLPEALAAGERAVTAARRDAEEMRSRLTVAESDVVHLCDRVSQLQATLAVTENARAENWADGEKPCPQCGRRLSNQQDIQAHAEHLAAEAERTNVQLKEVRSEQEKSNAQIDRLRVEVGAKQEALRSVEATYRQLIAAHQRELIERGEKAEQVNRDLSLFSELRKARDEVARMRKLSSPTPARPSPAVMLVEERSQWPAFAASLDLVTKHLFGSAASAKPTRTPDGIEVDFCADGVHESGGAALTALGSLAFDLAALRLAIADRTDLPGLWIHDSPKDANLASRSFMLLLRALIQLQHEAGHAFQYILTAAESPPDFLAGEDSHQVFLGAGTVDQLLLKCRYP